MTEIKEIDIEEVKEPKTKKSKPSLSTQDHVKLFLLEMWKDHGITHIYKQSGKIKHTTKAILPQTHVFLDFFGLFTELEDAVVDGVFQEDKTVSVDDLINKVK